MTPFPSGRMSAKDGVIPVCAWVRMNLPGFPTFIGFTYVDAEAGISAKGGNREDPNLAEAPGMTVRLPMPGVRCEPLPEEEIRQMGLPGMPTWVEEFYGPQPLAGKEWGAWRCHPRLMDLFHPDHPDDLEVVIHDGGPRLTDRRPELAWVRVTGGERDVFLGRLLNRPHQLATVSEGVEIQFIAPESGKHPLMVTSKYLSERPDWVIGPCNKCGLTELFDAPSDLIRVIFPNAPPGATVAAFTSFCGFCGGVQVVRGKSHPLEEIAAETPGRQARRWWQFWK
jgi:hypothetical protein